MRALINIEKRNCICQAKAIQVKDGVFIVPADICINCGSNASAMTLKNEIIEKARSLIKENMEIVLQVAYLLGESSAKAEQMLNLIIGSLEQNDNKKT